ncbi:MAG TPA: hypothetical protein VHV99_21445 [Paraburkholderia sp.]|nr:hypothetical protein [Paraburkholderia sp.]
MFLQYLEQARAERHQMIGSRRTGDREPSVGLRREHWVSWRDACLEAQHRRSFGYAAQKSEAD